MFGFWVLTSLDFAGDVLFSAILSIPFYILFSFLSNPS